MKMIKCSLRLFTRIRRNNSQFWTRTRAFTAGDLVVGVAAYFNSKKMEWSTTEEFSILVTAYENAIYFSLIIACKSGSKWGLLYITKTYRILPFA